MVEFIVAEDGTPFLTEINTRFWGSLQLAVDAGVDFPYLLYRAFMKEDLGPMAGYAEGKRLRWVLGDLDRLYLVLWDKGGEDNGFSDKVREVFAFLRPDFRRTKHEINRVTDIGPAVYELRKYFAALF